jgi:Tfp pilus assembly protein PilX
MSMPSNHNPYFIKRQVTAGRSAQSGISLLVVMVMLLVSSIAVLGATRFGWLGEAVTSNESDYQRTRAAADALMRDAMTDVMGYLPNGALCNAAEPAGGCRSQAIPNNPFIPMTWAELDDAGAVIAALPGYDANFPCVPRGVGVPGGLCIPTINPLGGAGAPANWWDNPALLAAMLPLGTTYGSATGNVADPNDPILSAPAAAPRGYYWLEAFKYQPTLTAPAGVDVPALQAKAGTPVYRITVLAQGLRPASRVVLQSLVVHPMNRLN